MIKKMEQNETFKCSKAYRSFSLFPILLIGFLSASRPIFKTFSRKSLSLSGEDPFTENCGEILQEKSAHKRNILYTALVSPTGGKQFQRIESINSETNINFIQVLINKPGTGLMGIYKPEKYPQSPSSCCPAQESPSPPTGKPSHRGDPSSSPALFNVSSSLLSPLHSSTPTAPTCQIFFLYLWKIFPKNGKISKVPGEPKGETLLNQKRGVPGPRVLWGKVQGEREQKENRCAQRWARDDISIFKVIGNRYGPLGLLKEINNIFLVVYEM